MVTTALALLSAMSVFADFHFTNTLSHTVTFELPVVPDYPCTVDLCFTPDSAWPNGCLWSEANTASDINYIQLYEDIATGTLTCGMVSAGAGSAATTTNTMSAGTRYHCTWIAASSTSRRVVIGGDWANSGHDTNALAWPTGIDGMDIGTIRISSFPNGVNFAKGTISDVAIWTRALLQSEVESLAAGAPPSRIGRGSLAFYLPMHNDNAYSWDVASGYLGTPVTTDPADFVGGTNGSRQGTR